MILLQSNYIYCLLIFVARSYAVSLLGVLQSNSELSTLYNYITATSNATNSTTLLTNANDFTFLAPSNNAFKSFAASGTNVTSDLLKALIEYSLLHGGYPSLSFTNNSQFVKSNLVNASLTNVTAGQNVELVRGANGIPQVITGNKSISTSPEADIVCTGGIVHIMDEVPTFPLTASTQISASKLEYFVSILSTGGYLNASNAVYVSRVLELKDMTFFIPNSAQALQNFSAVSKNLSPSDLQAIFQYHIVQGFVGFTPQLVTGMNLTTIQGSNVTITVQNNLTYVNGAQIIASDYIVENGVVHVIDNFLDRFNTSPPPKPTATPTNTTASIPTPTSSTSSTSTSAIASVTASPSVSATPAPSADSGTSGSTIGIAVGVTLGGLLVIGIIAWFLWRRRKANRAGNVEPITWDDRSMFSSPNQGYVEKSPRYGNTTTVHAQQPGMGLNLRTEGIHTEDSSTVFGVPYNTTEEPFEGPSIPPRSPSRAFPGRDF